jgi:RHS repeat-associated protein
MPVLHLPQLLSGHFISQLKTPYGVTKFAAGETEATTRWLEITDARGYSSRTETRHNAPGIAYSEAAEDIPTGLVTYNGLLNARNTYHWNPRAWPWKNDYNQADIKHWLHSHTQSSTTANTLESLKTPGESRIWFNYDGQSGSFNTGTCGQPSVIARVLPDGSTQRTQLRYNAKGHLTGRIDPLGRETRHTYAANGIDLIRVEQRNGKTWDTLAEITWNDQHRPLTFKDAAGVGRQYGWNAAGQLTSHTDALGQTTRYDYDEVGHLIQVTNALGRLAARYTYDGYGQLASETDAEGHTLAHEHDALGRRTRTRWPDGTTTEWRWDRLDLAEVKDRNNQYTQYQYDATRNLIEVKNALRTLQYGYDEAGGLTRLTDGNGQSTYWERDRQGRVIHKRHPDGHGFSYSHDSVGRMVQKRNSRTGQASYYAYAADDRLTDIAHRQGWNIPSGVVGIDIPIQQPPPGFGTGTADPAQPEAIHLSWDAAYPRLSALTDGTVGTTHYQYHPVGQLGALRLHSETAPNGQPPLTLDYDALGRLQHWQLNTGAGANGERYDYDPLGRIVATQNDFLGHIQTAYLGDTGQVTSTRSAIEHHYNYEPNESDRRLKSIAHSGHARGYTYVTAPEHRITQMIETLPAQNRTWQYQYDALERLQGATRDDLQHYAYTLDPADNLTAITDPDGPRGYVPDTANKIAQAPYLYDDNGNRIEDEHHTYQWDLENRLVGIGYKAEPQRATEMRYDGLGHRVAIIEKLNDTVTSEIRYTWCGSQICMARDQDDQPIAYYFNEGSFYPKTNQRHYYARDHLGSVRDVLDQAGNNLARYDYDPYGKLTNNPTTPPEFGYAGMQYHAPSGLYLTLYRVYDPKDGRWLSRDPIEEEGGINLYAYVGGNPVNAIDPSGLLKVYGYQNRGGGSGWVTQYQLQFNPLSARPGLVLTKTGRIFNRLDMVIDLIDTKPVGPNNPINYVECGLLDAKLQKEYERAGFTDGQRLTRTQAEGFLNDMYLQFPEMRGLYPSPAQMLDVAESNSMNHWVYQMKPGN